VVSHGQSNCSTGGLQHRPGSQAAGGCWPHGKHAKQNASNCSTAQRSRALVRDAACLDRLWPLGSRSHKMYEHRTRERACIVFGYRANVKSGTGTSMARAPEHHEKTGRCHRAWTSAGPLSGFSTGWSSVLM
jgi:hypothetical protein